MSDRRGLLAEISWFQLAVSALAAVTAAWIASSLGVAGTLIGAALGSFVVTISSAFYGRTLEKSKTLLVQTASGTIVQKAVQDGDIAEAFEEVEEVEHSPVARAEVVDTPPRLHWKTIAATTVIVLGIALAAISAFEIVSGQSLDGSGGTTIGDTFGGSKATKPEPTPTPSSTTPAPSPSTPTSTPAPSPSPSTPTPAPSTPTPTPDTTAPVE